MLSDIDLALGKASLQNIHPVMSCYMTIPSGYKVLLVFHDTPSTLYAIYTAAGNSEWCFILNH